MIIGIAGYSIKDTNLFSDGYKQNVIFFCEFIEKYFTEHNIIPIQSDDFIYKYDKIDVIIQLTPFSKELSNKVKNKYPECHNIFVKYGHEYYNDLQRLLPDGQNDVHHSPKAYNIDQVFISPHFDTTKYYYQSLYNAKVSIAPFIWKPDNILLKSYSQLDYDNCKEKNIYIVEPNINLLKTSLIPIMIVNELWRKKPNSFDKLFIVSNNMYSRNTYFTNELLPKIEILNGKYNKAYFCERANINDIFRKPCVLLSHQENLGLNYIYLEAMYLKIQWVHNSPFFKTKYYYQDKNIFDGVEKLELALNDWQAIDNSVEIDKYSPDNKNIIAKYKELITNF